MRRLIPILLLLLAGCGGSQTAAPPLHVPEPTRTVHVVDADTIDIDGIRYRLHGIDAPESYQTCRAWGYTWECGKAATHALMSHAGDISCQASSASDRYGRTIGRCTTSQGVDVNAWLVAHGWALAAYSTDYHDEEAQARTQRRGIHQGMFVNPSDRRRGQRLEGQDTLAGVSTPAPVDLPQLANGLLWGTDTIDGQHLRHSVFGITDTGAAVSFGDWPATDPSVSGTATWTGSMVAITDAGTHRTTGTALLTLEDLAEPRVNLKLSGPDVVTFNWSDIPLRDGSFNAGDGSMQGRFYGTQHQEAGGVFARDGWLGAFGARR